MNRLKWAMEKIQELPESRNLLMEIQKEKPVSFAVSEHDLSNQFGAFWDLDQRVICVNCSPARSDGRIIGSILFEMHNALATAQFEDLDARAERKEIDRESYVQSIEYIEFLNSKKASKIAEIGVKAGIFPEEARLFTYKDFEEHYHYQKIGKHSDWIAKTYDGLAAGRRNS